MNSINPEILLTIFMEGGALVRQDEVENLNWVITERDQNPNKQWKDNDGYKVVSRGSTPHQNLVAKNCHKVMHISSIAYKHFIDAEYNPFPISKKVWTQMTKVERLHYHLECIAKDAGGFKFTHEMLED